MIPYIVVYSLLVPGILFETRDNKISSKKKLLFFYILVFTLFRGLRWNTGTDWNQYLYHFQNLNINNIFNYSRYGGDETLEPLYALINVIIGICGNYSCFLIITNLFILYTYYYFSIKYTPKPIITFALILLCAGFFPVRLELAATFLMWSIPPLIKRKLSLFISIVLTAFLIHKSAIVFIPFYWLLNYPLKLPIQIIFYTACCFLINEILIRNFILSISLIIPFDSVQKAAQSYLEASFDYNINKVTSKFTSYLMTVLFLTILYICPLKKTNLYKSSTNAYFFLSCISQVIPESISDLSRIGSFFIWGLPIAFSYTFNYYLKTKFKYISLILLMLYCIYKFIRMCNIFPNELFPYYSIFSSPPYVR